MSGPRKVRGAFATTTSASCTSTYIKQLPKLHVGSREFRKRHLYIAIDRRSRSVHLAVKEDTTEPSATAFLREVAQAFPFRLTHVLTDCGSCFNTGAFSKARAALGAQHRTTKPCTAQTNSMEERFNAGTSARCWSSPSARTATSNACSRATSRPATPSPGAC